MNDVFSVRSKMYLNALKIVFPYSNLMLSNFLDCVAESLCVKLDFEASIENYSQVLTYIWDKMKASEMARFGLSQSNIDLLIDGRKTIEVEAEYNRLLSEEISIIVRGSSEYPYMLSISDDAPLILYIKGKKHMLNANCIAIVGSREPTKYGLEVVKRIVSGCASFDCSIVSGCAVGIDKQAHISCIKEKIPTIGVIGSGFGFIKNQTGIFGKLNDDFALISEFPYTVTPTKFTFPMRNRIIAGLSRGVIVVEARMRSGALITARQSLDSAREVYCVPGSLFSDLSLGTHELIKKSSAKIFTNTDEVMAEMGFIKRQQKFAENSSISFTREELKIFKNLKTPKSFDELIRVTKIDAGSLSALISRLELNDQIVKIDQGKFALIP